MAGLMTEQLEAENILFTPKVEKPTVLIEWACSETSELGVQGTKLGMVVIRAGLAEALQKISKTKVVTCMAHFRVQLGAVFND